MQAIASKVNFYELNDRLVIQTNHYESLILAQDERWRRA